MEHFASGQHLAVDWALLAKVLLLTVPICLLAGLILAVYATIVSARVFPATCAPLWIILCWFLPIIGPVAALIAAKKQKNLESIEWSNEQGGAVGRQPLSSEAIQTPAGLPPAGSP